MISNSNKNNGSIKDYVSRMRYQDSIDRYHFISTETRNWIIRDRDIRNDGSILNAVLQPRAKAVNFHRLTRGERIN